MIQFVVFDADGYPASYGICTEADLPAQASDGEEAVAVTSLDNVLNYRLVDGELTYQ